MASTTKDWLTVNPNSGGQNGASSTSVTLTAAEYTGNSPRSKTVTFQNSTRDQDGADGAKASVTVNQGAASEYITISTGATGTINACTGSGASAGAVTHVVTGISNAKNIKVSAQEAFTLSGVTVALGIMSGSATTYTTVAGWNGYTSIAVTGNPGSSGAYKFQLIFTIPENPSVNQRVHTTDLITSDGTTGPSVAITQRASEKTYSEITVTKWPTYTDIPAAGGTVSPNIDSVAYSQTWGINGRTTRGVNTHNETTASGVVTSGGTWSYTDDTGSQSWSDTDVWDSDETWNHSSNTGVPIANGSVTAASLGSTVTGRTKIKTIFATLTLNDKTAKSSAITVYQEPNVVISISPNISISVSSYTVPASGFASEFYCKAVPENPTFEFTSGASVSTNASTYGAISYTYEWTTASSIVLSNTTSMQPTLFITSLGTTLTKLTPLGSVSVTVGGVFTPSSVGDSASLASKSFTSSSFTMDANIITKIELATPSMSTTDGSAKTVARISYPTVSASGGTSSPSFTAPSIVYTFSSGAKTTNTPNSIYGSLTALTQSTTTKKYTFATSVDTLQAGFSKDSDFTTTGKITASDRGTTLGDARYSLTSSQYVIITFNAGDTWVPASGYGSSVSTTTSVSAQVASGLSQAANTVSISSPSITDITTATIPASGGNVASTYYTASAVATYASGSVRATKQVKTRASTNTTYYLDESLLSSTPSSIGCPELAIDYIMSNGGASITGAHLGRNILAETKKGSIATICTATVESTSNITTSRYVDVYQAANQITSYGVINWDDVFITIDPIAYTYEADFNTAWQARTYTSGTADADISQGITTTSLNNDTDTTSQLITLSAVSEAAAKSGFSLTKDLSIKLVWVNIEANPGVDRRYGYVVNVTLAGNGKTAEKTITINQNGSASTLTITNTSGDRISAIDVAAAGGSQIIKVASNDTWTTTIS